MKINVILAGLENENRESVLKRIEFFKEGLPMEAVFCCLDVDTYGFDVDVLKTAVKFIDDNSADFTIFSGNYVGKDLGKKVAALTGKKCLVDVDCLEYQDDGLKAVRKIYSTHLEKIDFVQDSIVIPSLEGEKGSEPFEWEKIEFEGIKADEEQSYSLIGEEALEVSENLGEAKVVLLGGKGLGNKANFQRLESLAKRLGASCGSARLAALSGWAGYDKIVGISGWSLNADVCIAFGVSGAGPLLQGLKGVKKIIAVNNDRKAPIFRHADYGIEADCLEVIEAMEKLADEKGSV